MKAVATMAKGAGWQVWEASRSYLTVEKPGRLISIATRKMPTSAIVATAIISATVDEKHATGPWKVPGEFGWHFEQLQVLATPIDPGPGFHQGFWPLRA